MSTRIVRKEINHNGVIYRINGEKWEVLMFGTYGPSCGGIPSYRFERIEESRVPREVISAA